eukprot:CAMPEP_0184868120 /NCGR_PEP_ID=MMETSP0580-20130426/29213_1 /TAXON_ID=1118495 /ORGANISM="Dactyliosolen fragilissimus" /LENGTH=184 /DNA_ID=CAMNT_0027368787 /DNA_START=115 /DNA_END=666 /DNA_ORIENTATION=-
MTGNNESYILSNNLNYIGALADTANYQEDDDFLAEILAEEKRREQELQELQDEMNQLNQFKMENEHLKDRTLKSGRSSGPASGIPGASQKDLDDLEEILRQKEALAREKRREINKESEEKMLDAKNREIAEQREAKYMAELEKQTNEKKRKSMIRQKKLDSKIVRRILRLKGNHYAVLGFRCQW